MQIWNHEGDSTSNYLDVRTQYRHSSALVFGSNVQVLKYYPFLVFWQLGHAEVKVLKYSTHSYA